MKRIICVILVCVLMVILCGCGDSKIVDENGKTRTKYGPFVEVVKYRAWMHYSMCLVYDEGTKIVYVMTDEGGGVSPYYIVYNGQPTIAIYGKNFWA